MENTLAKPENTGVLNRNQIKYIVIVAMLIDHIAWAFVDAVNPFLGACMHFIGRLTGPTMAYFVAEGYYYTKDVGKYQKRLAIFALISWFPFVYFEYGSLFRYYGHGIYFLNPMQGVIFTLFLGLTAIRIWESSKIAKPTKIICIIMLCMISSIGDWMFIDVLGCLAFHIYRDRPRAKWIAYVLIFFVPCILLTVGGGFYYVMPQFGILLVPLMLGLLYNGQGGSKAQIHKWFFYIFYPAHLAILGLLEWVILR